MKIKIADVQAWCDGIHAEHDNEVRALLRLARAAKAVAPLALVWLTDEPYQDELREALDAFDFGDD